MRIQLGNLQAVDLHAMEADIVAWKGRECLRLENGLALIPNQMLVNARVELLIGTEGPAYSGVAFRVADILNYELAYAVPHVSGEWDAIQYDPVFHGVNTWQIYHGPFYQQKAEIPTGAWFLLKIDYYQDRCKIMVDDQPPLIVEQLAQPISSGGVGIWTFKPAHFAEMRISQCYGFESLKGKSASIPEESVASWFLDGYGNVGCEPNGVLNLNRYLPNSIKIAHLRREFETQDEKELTFDIGFSDELKLMLDGEEIFSGVNIFEGFSNRASRGYIEPGSYQVQRIVSPGAHRLEAKISAKEGFGWGLILAARGEGLDWLPSGIN